MAVAGGVPTPFGGPVSPERALIRPEAQRPEGARELPGVPPRAAPVQPLRARRTGVQRAAPTGRVSAIDKLLAEGTGAQVLIPALARVGKPDEALRIVLERAIGWRGRGTLPAPMRQLVEQVQAATDDLPSHGRSRRTASGSPRREALRRRRRQSSRRRNVHVPATEASATVHHVQANFRIVGLVKKLEQLIHLVDVEHRLAAARAQVRMSDSAPAQQTVHGDAAPDGQAQREAQDVDALIQDIVEYVSEEFALYAMRRPEAPTDRSPWF